LYIECAYKFKNHQENDAAAKNLRIIN